MHRANNNNNQCTLTKLEDFLGVTKDSIEVINSKLSDVERAELETALTVPELDEAIDQCNLKSAPGADGLSNKFIKHFWEYVRIPLYKYALACFNSGSLTDNFRSANIRLIPKKGKEPGSIKNWRPISLLNCFYKCFSRAIANRLKKYMDKLCPRAQKGYSNTKYGQEVLMGVIETIEKCNFLKRKGAILSLDIRKAFDSLSHSYLKCVYKLYNFGPNMIRWLTLLGTNRRACVVLNSGMKTIFFYLEQGNAQGDTLSPFLFNLGYQLLIMKLEFDLQIQGLIERVDLPETHPIPPPQPRRTRGKHDSP